MYSAVFGDVAAICCHDPGEALIACGQDRGRTWSRQPPGRQRRHRAPREEPHIGDHDDDPGDAAPSRDRPRPGSRSAPIFHTDFHGLLLPRFLDLLARQRRMPIELVVCASRPTSGCHPDSDPETQRPRRLIGNRRRPGRATPRSRTRRSVGSFDCAREVGARRDVHLVEDVAQVGFDRLLAQEEFRGDLRIGLALDDELRHLEFALGQRCDARSVGPSRP